jgi:hypothetical protein
VTAIAGTFADFKIVRGRKCAQLVIEVPLEKADAALVALGGLPNPSAERWVGIAPLTSEPKPAAQELEQHPAKRRFNEMPRAQQAAIRCQEPEFIRFLNATVIGDMGWDAAPSKEDAAQVVRHLCGVDSRSEIDRSERARVTWDRLENDYWIWQRDPRRAA